MSFFDILIALLIISPAFFLGDMARWQRIGYVTGAGIWLLNLLFIGSGAIWAVSLFILFISCIEVIIKHFPIRAG